MFLKKILILFLGFLGQNQYVNAIKYDNFEGGIVVEVVNDTAIFYTDFHMDSFHAGIDYSFSKDTLTTKNKYILTMFFRVSGGMPSNFRNLDWGGIQLRIPLPDHNVCEFWYKDGDSAHQIIEMSEKEYRDSINR